MIPDRTKQCNFFPDEEWTKYTVSEALIWKAVFYEKVNIS